MFFANRWVSMDVMNTIFILWALIAFVILGLIIWLAYKSPLTNSKPRVQMCARGKKRKKRKH